MVVCAVLGWIFRLEIGLSEVRGGLMPHPDAIPRSSSSSEWPYSNVVFYILYFFLFLCLCDHSIPFEIRGRTMASAFISPLQPGLEPRPAVTKPQPFLPTLMMMMMANGDDGLAAMIASVFKYLRAIRCLRFACCSIICLKITLVCRVLSPLTGCGLDDQDTNQF